MALAGVPSVGTAHQHKAHHFIFPGGLVVLCQRYGHVATAQNSSRVTCMDAAGNIIVGRLCRLDLTDVQLV